MVELGLIVFFVLVLVGVTVSIGYCFLFWFLVKFAAMIKRTLVGE